MAAVALLRLLWLCLAGWLCLAAVAVAAWLWLWLLAYLIDVLIHNLVDLRAQLLGDLRLLRLHHLAHHGDQILPALRLRVREVEVVQRHVLDDLLALMHVSLWQRHVLLSLEIELGREGVAAADALDRARVRLDVDHVARRHLLLLQGLVDARVELELLRALGRL